MAFFQGYLVLVIRGDSLVKLLNLATVNGIYLWDIRRFGNNTIQLKIGIQGYRALRPFLRKTRSRSRVRQRKGAPFFTGQLLKRPFWLVGILIAAALLFFTSTLVLFIRIEGVPDPKGKLRAELRGYGVVSGMVRGRLMGKMESIEREMKIRHPEFLWIDLKTQGVLLRVIIVKRTTPPRMNPPSDLVAGKDGRVLRLTVIQGTPVVQEGDTVAKGDRLLAGFQIIKEINGDSFVKKVEPKGRVEAAVGYQAIADVPLLIWKCQPTGRQRTILWLRYRGRLNRLLAWGKAKGQVFHVLKRKTLKSGRNPSALVELIIDHVNEVRWVQRRVPVNQALREARRLSRIKLRQSLAKGVRPLRTWEDWQIEGGFLVYRLTAETNEEITVPVWEE